MYTTIQGTYTAGSTAFEVFPSLFYMPLSLPSGRLWNPSTELKSASQFNVNSAVEDTIPKIASLFSEPWARILPRQCSSAEKDLCRSNRRFYISKTENNCNCLQSSLSKFWRVKNHLKHLHAPLVHFKDSHLEVCSITIPGFTIIGVNVRDGKETEWKRGLASYPWQSCNQRLPKPLL